MLNDNTFFVYISTKKIVIILWSLIIEELGWREFLEEKLEGRIKDIFIPFVIGLIWGAWHYHFILIESFDIPLLAFFIGCIFESIGYFFYHKKSIYNVLPASVMHMMGNLMINILTINCLDKNNGYLPYYVFTILSFIYVIIFVVDLIIKNKKEDKQ